MKITKQQFLADVMHEIEMLKSHATDKEKNKLDFYEFDPEMPSNCIYGQMTGHCESKRAKELMDVSCKRVFHIKDGRKGNGAGDLLNQNFTDIKKWVNGQYTGQTWVGNDSRSYRFLSALEGYINLSGAKNEEILKYIKGEISTLSL